MTKMGITISATTMSPNTDRSTILNVRCLNTCLLNRRFPSSESGSGAAPPSLPPDPEINSPRCSMFSNPPGGFCFECRPWKVNAGML